MFPNHVGGVTDVEHSLGESAAALGSGVRYSGQSRDRSGLRVGRKIVQTDGGFVGKPDEVLRDGLRQPGCGWLGWGPRGARRRYTSMRSCHDDTVD